MPTIQFTPQAIVFDAALARWRTGAVSVLPRHRPASAAAVRGAAGRRMADTAAFLADEVLPDVPFRQWVLSLPHRLRLACANDPVIARAVRGVLVRTVSSFYLRQAHAAGWPRPRAGAVVVDQRFDSAVRLDRS
jgi:hypothetical protein